MELFNTRHLRVAVRRCTWSMC